MHEVVVHLQCNKHLRNVMSLDLEFLVSDVGKGTQSCVFVESTCVCIIWCTELLCHAMRSPLIYLFEHVQKHSY